MGGLILLDAYAVVALLADEPAGEEVEPLLASGRAAIPLVTLAEAIDIAIRVHRVTPRRARRDMAILTTPGPLSILRLAQQTAWRAAEVRAAHYDRRDCALSLADCLLLATAGPDDEIATPDPPVAEVARREGIGVIALPDSSGRRP